MSKYDSVLAKNGPLDNRREKSIAGRPAREKIHPNTQAMINSLIELPSREQPRKTGPTLQRTYDDEKEELQPRFSQGKE